MPPLPGYHQYFLGVNMSCSRTRHRDPRGARTPTSGSGVRGLNQATALPYPGGMKSVIILQMTLIHHIKQCCGQIPTHNLTLSFLVFVITFITSTYYLTPRENIQRWLARKGINGMSFSELLSRSTINCSFNLHLNLHLVMD